MSILKFKDENGEWSGVASLRGAKGETGNSGVHIGEDRPDDPNINVWIKPDGEPGGFVPIDEKLEEIESKLSEEIVNVLPSEIAKVSVPKPVETPVVGKVLKVKSVNEDGTFVCEWADGGGDGKVKDVQINGASILADNGIADIPIAQGEILGAVKADPFYGINISATGKLQVESAYRSHIDGRTDTRHPIASNNLDYSVRAAMCDGKGAEWAQEEQAAARERIGAESSDNVELIEEISFNVDTPSYILSRHETPSGERYDSIYKELFVYMCSKAGASSGSDNQNISLGKKNCYLVGMHSPYTKYGYAHIKSYGLTEYVDGAVAQESAGDWTPMRILAQNIYTTSTNLGFDMGRNANVTWKAGSYIKIYGVRK